MLVSKNVDHCRSLCPKIPLSKVPPPLLIIATLPVTIESSRRASSLGHEYWRNLWVSTPLLHTVLKFVVINDLKPNVPVGNAAQSYMLWAHRKVGHIFHYFSGIYSALWPSLILPKVLYAFSMNSLTNSRLTLVPELQMSLKCFIMQWRVRREPVKLVSK